MREVCIAGVGRTRFGRWPDKSSEQIGQEAVFSALEDANAMDVSDVQACICGSVYGGTAIGQRTLAGVGYTGIPIINIETGCSTGATAIIMAYQYIAGGLYDIVLALGIEKLPKGFIVNNAYPEWQMLSGLGVNPIHYALKARHHMETYGLTHEQIARVSVKSHRNGALNPNAMFQKVFSLEEVLASKMVCDPLRVLELSAPCDGAAAAVLCTREVAAKYNAKPITIAAACTATPKYGTFYTLQGAGGGDESTKIRHELVTTITARKAYETSGVGPEDLDLVELQDTSAAAELCLMEELLLCPEGESGKLIDEGRTEIDGDMPVTPSGGILSNGQPASATGISQVAEIVWQLRGAGGKRQVKNAKVGMAQAVGAGGNGTVIILKR